MNGFQLPLGVLQHIPGPVVLRVQLQRPSEDTNSPFKIFLLIQGLSPIQKLREFLTLTGFIELTLGIPIGSVDMDNFLETLNRLPAVALFQIMDGFGIEIDQFLLLLGFGQTGHDILTTWLQS